MSKRLIAALVAAVAVLIGGAAVAQSTQRFSDVPADHPQAAAIGWAADAGLTRGFEDGTFRPDEPLPRWAALTFMDRFYDTVLGGSSAGGFTRGDMMELLHTISRGTVPATTTTVPASGRASDVELEARRLIAERWPSAAATVQAVRVNILASACGDPAETPGCYRLHTGNVYIDSDRLYQGSQVDLALFVHEFVHAIHHRMLGNEVPDHDWRALCGPPDRHSCANHLEYVAESAEALLVPQTRCIVPNIPVGGSCPAGQDQIKFHGYSDPQRSTFTEWIDRMLAGTPTTTTTTTTPTTTTPPSTTETWPTLRECRSGFTYIDDTPCEASTIAHQCHYLSYIHGQHGAGVTLTTEPPSHADCEGRSWCRWRTGPGQGDRWDSNIDLTGCESTRGEYHSGCYSTDGCRRLQTEIHSHRRANPIPACWHNWHKSIFDHGDALRITDFDAATRTFTAYGDVFFRDIGYRPSGPWTVVYDDNDRFNTVNNSEIGPVPVTLADFENAIQRSFGSVAVYWTITECDPSAVNSFTLT